MALEWVGPVATGVVGVVGIGATVWTQREGRRTTAELAADARVNDRRRLAYERIILTAIKTTEFVGYADVIWSRSAEPPDVDYKNFDAWMLLDLYASRDVYDAYFAWSDAVEAARQILDEVPHDETWYTQGDELAERFNSAKERMDDRLRALKHAARDDLA